MRFKLPLHIIAICAVLFLAGIAVGQRISPSKFDKYLRPTNSTEMDIIALNVNLESVRNLWPMESGISVPMVYYDQTEKQPAATVSISPAFEKQPLDTIRSLIVDRYAVALAELKARIPELSEDDFAMRVSRNNPKDADHLLFAECKHGSIVFH